ncbi:probable leucine-rich repeat receptor-like protein kinase At1g35710 [Lytechinus variegatus]|uniref:probable leucine-rich repeat receptor-like protein kinase At1g35710 n=1 Tax=Lytechinus variegatus TaxID=7654 RepID=UPI001BB1DB39|nr:probable leucine-rich repeat receptor-like protein kinase At1g35710 [Lytechinus variegatus]
MDIIHQLSASVLMTLVGLLVTDVTMASFRRCSTTNESINCYGRNLNRIPRIPSSVTFVNLANNNLDSVLGESFEGAVSLKVLSLDNNSIQYLQAAWGRDVGNLFRLSLNNNLLTAMHNATLLGLGDLTNILLCHNKIKTLFRGWCDGAENISRIDLSENQISSIDFTNWCSFSRLEYLNLSNNKIKHLHSNWTEGMVNLEYLDLQNNNLKVLRYVSFSFLTSLFDLRIRNNSIETIEVGWGRDLGKLATLQLSKNKLRRLQPSSFSGMTSLTRIDLQSANVRTIQNSFNRLEGLEELSLQYNSIAIIHEGDFSDLRSVETLSLQSNAIYHLEPRSFRGMDSLGSLYLNNNKIVTLMPDTFAGLRMLTHLYLQNNNIGYLSDCWNIDLDNVVFIDMGRNNLTSIDTELSNCSHSTTPGIDTIWTLTSLEILYLSRTRIESLLHRGIFQGLVELRSLILSYCDLQSIEEIFFEGLQSMKYIDISNNYIVRLDSFAFRSVPSLIGINARSNEISSMGSYTFSGRRLLFVDLRKNALQTLSRDVLPNRIGEFELRLSQNPIQCDCRVEWLHKLITNNRIRMVDISFLSTLDLILPQGRSDVTNIKCVNFKNKRLTSIPINFLPCDPSWKLKSNVTTPLTSHFDVLPKTTSSRQLPLTKLLTQGSMSTNDPTVPSLGDVIKGTGELPKGDNDAFNVRGSSPLISNLTISFLIVGLILVVVLNGVKLSPCGRNCRKISIKARSVIYQDINNSLVTEPVTGPHEDLEDDDHRQINRNFPVLGHIRLSQRDIRPDHPPPPIPPRPEDLVQAFDRKHFSDPNILQADDNVVLSEMVVKHTYLCRGKGHVVGNQRKDRLVTAHDQEAGSRACETLTKPMIRHIYHRNLVPAAEKCPERKGIHINANNRVVTEALIHAEAPGSRFTRSETTRYPQELSGVFAAVTHQVLAKRHNFFDPHRSSYEASNESSFIRADDFERDCESHENSYDDGDSSDASIYNANHDELHRQTIDPLPTNSSEVDWSIPTIEIDNDIDSDYGEGTFQIHGEESSNGCSFGMVDRISELELGNIDEIMSRETPV